MARKLTASDQRILPAAVPDETLIIPRVICKIFQATVDSLVVVFKDRRITIGILLTCDGKICFSICWGAKVRCFSRMDYVLPG